MNGTDSDKGEDILTSSSGMSCEFLPLRSSTVVIRTGRELSRVPRLAPGRGVCDEDRGDDLGTTFSGTEESPVEVPEGPFPCKGCPDPGRRDRDGATLRWESFSSSHRPRLLWSPWVLPSPQNRRNPVLTVHLVPGP